LLRRERFGERDGPLLLRADGIGGQVPRQLAQLLQRRRPIGLLDAALEVVEREAVIREMLREQPDHALPFALERDGDVGLPRVRRHGRARSYGRTAP
jgi:hypothetical protein